MKHPLIRFLSLFMTVLMLFTSVDLQVFAAELPEEDVVAVETTEVEEATEIIEKTQVVETAEVTETSAVEMQTAAASGAAISRKIMVNGEACYLHPNFDYTEDSSEGIEICSLMCDMAIDYGNRISIAINPDDFYVGTYGDYASAECKWDINREDIYQGLNNSSEDEPVFDHTGNDIEINLYTRYVLCEITYRNASDERIAFIELNIDFCKLVPFYTSIDLRGDRIIYKGLHDGISLRAPSFTAVGYVGEEKEYTLDVECLLPGDSVVSYDWRQRVPISETISTTDSCKITLEEGENALHCLIKNSYGDIIWVQIYIYGESPVENAQTKVPDKSYYSEAGGKDEWSSMYSKHTHGAGYPVVVMTTIDANQFPQLVEGNTIYFSGCEYTIFHKGEKVAEGPYNAPYAVRKMVLSDSLDGKHQFATCLGYFDFEEEEEYSISAKIYIGSGERVPGEDEDEYDFKTHFNGIDINGTFTCMPKDSNVTTIENPVNIGEEVEVSSTLNAIRRVKEATTSKVELKATVGNQYATVATGSITEKTDSNICINEDLYEATEGFMDPDELVDHFGYKSDVKVKYSDLAGVRALSNGTKLDQVVTFSDGTEYTFKNAYVVESDGEFVSVETKKIHYIIAKEGTKLGDVTLSNEDGGSWSWKNPDEKLVADNTCPVQYFEAVFKKDNNVVAVAQIPVAVSEITGIHFTMDQTKIPGGKELAANAEVFFDFKGYKPAEWEFFTGRYADMDPHGLIDCIQLKGDGLEIIHGATDRYGYMDTDPFFFHITGNAVTKDTDRNLTAYYVVGGKEIFKSTAKKIKVTAKQYVQDIQLKDANGTVYGAGYLYSQDYAGQSVSMELSAKVAYESSPAEAVFNTDTEKFFGENKGKLQWTSSDSSVLEVKPSADTKTAKITIKKAGIAVLTVKAKDTGAYTEEFIVDAVDKTPILASNKISIKRYGQAVDMGLSACYGNAITDVQLDESSKANLVVAQDTKGKWRLSYKEGAEYKKSVSAKIAVFTADGKTTNFGLKVNVSNNAPSLKAKQTVKGNVFYKNERAYSLITLSSSNAIVVDVQDNPAAGTTPVFTVQNYDANNSVVTFAVNSSLQNADNLNTIKKSQKVPVKVKYNVDGVEVTKNETITVAPTYKAPALKVNEARLIGGADTAMVSVTNTTDKLTLDLGQYDVSAVDATPVVAVEDKVGGKIKVKALSLKKNSINYTLAIKNADWFDAIKVKGKLSKSAKQELVLEKTKVTVNGNYDSQTYGSLVIPMKLKNSNAAIDYSKTECTPADAKTENAMTAGYVKLALVDGQDAISVLIGKNENDRFKDYLTGTYKFKIAVTDENGVKTSPVTLTIVSSAKKTNVNLKTAGKIDLSKRGSSCVTVTGTIVGESDSIVAMSIDSSSFRGDYDEATGKMKIYAKPKAMLRSNTSYDVTVNISTSLGVHHEKTIKIKPSYTKPKLKASASTITLYRSAAGDYKTVSVSSTNAKINYMDFASSSFVSQYLNVEDRTQVAGADYTALSFSLNDSAKKLKKGTYTVSLYAEVEGAPINMANPTVKVKIVVK